MDTTSKPTYTYADGSNNRYELRIDTCTLRYLPIKPAESSTGFYDGGIPFTITISEEDCSALIRLLGQAIEEKSFHDTEGRKKGAGWVNKLSMSEAYCLVQGAPVQKEIETILFKHRDANK